MPGLPLEQIGNFVRQREHEMLALLERIVNINSHTPNKAGVDAVGAVLAETMREMGFAVRTDAKAEAGDNLVAENALSADPASRAKNVLLVGHMDTVFPEDSPFQAMRREGETIVGPGVVDMKGGLVVGIYALKALQDAGLLDDMPVAFLFNSDEEIGSPGSKDLVMREARRSAFAFVFECSGLGGETVTGRKGKTTYHINATGRAGHSGAVAGAKPSAVLELAHKTIALEALNDPRRGVSLNVGLSAGGIGPNTVAPSAEAVAECRFVSAKDGENLHRAIEDIVQTPTIPGTSCTVDAIPGRPPMEQTKANKSLLQVVLAVGSELDIPVGEDFRGGVSDANFIAHVGTPVIDGMGPSGDRDHSPDEYMIAESLVSRTILAAASLRACWDRYQAEAGKGE